MLTIKKIASEHGYSNSKLARIADMNQVTVGQILNGRLIPYPGQIAKLANALNWDGNPDDLFKEVEE